MTLGPSLLFVGIAVFMVGGARSFAALRASTISVPATMGEHVANLVRDDAMWTKATPRDLRRKYMFATLVCCAGLILFAAGAIVVSPDWTNWRTTLTVVIATYLCGYIALKIFRHRDLLH
jgi:hypothetical protein